MGFLPTSAAVVFSAGLGLLPSIVFNRKKIETPVFLPTLAQTALGSPQAVILTKSYPNYK